MIAPTPFFSHRGTRIRILEEARALERLGHDITIVTYHIGDDIYKYIDTNIDVRRIHKWLFWYKKTEAGADWQKVVLNIFLIRKIIYLTFIKKPDIIHGHLHEGVIMGWFLQKIFFWRNIPLVSDFHGSLVGEMQSHGYLKFKPLARIFSFLEKFINSLGDVSMVSSAENSDSIRNSRKDNRVYHIGDGVNTDEYNRLKLDKDELRKKYNLPSDKIIVVYTGALIANKGVNILLDAIKLNKNESLFFVIGGFPCEWVNEYIDNFNLKNVKVISPLNYFELAEVNSLADIAIDPKPMDDSIRQASGKILQYMGAGLPIVCLDRPTNRIYLDKAGKYIQKLLPEDILEAINDLSDNKEAMSNMGRLAKQRADKFSWNFVGEKIEGLYKMFF